MKSWIVCGLGWGDEGKGACVDYLTRREGAGLVVRFNGGAQAAHNVVTPDGVHHCFHTWGSGTLARAQTYLGPEFLYDPVVAKREAEQLKAKGVSDPWDELWVDPRCPVVTPWHVALNRVQQRASGHGTCGMGIGAVAADVAGGRDVLRVMDLYNGTFREVAMKANAIRTRLGQALLDAGPAVGVEVDLMRQDASEWLDAVRTAPDWPNVSDDPPKASVAVFEGAQGVLLDQDHGFQPHTTWSDCTAGGARRILREWADRGCAPDVTTLGVLRAFATRHGAGPFPTELAPPLVGWESGEHNAYGPFQGSFRYGWFDAVLASYALTVQPVDGLVLSCLDRVAGHAWHMCTDYFSNERVGPAFAGAKPRTLLSARSVTEAVEMVEVALKTPVVIKGFGPSSKDYATVPQEAHV